MKYREDEILDEVKEYIGNTYNQHYGKKDGKNRKDLLKAIHYIVLLMSSEDKQ